MEGLPCAIVQLFCNGTDMKALSFPSNVRIPSGATATRREMKEYGVVIQKFIAETKASLDTEEDPRRRDVALDYLNHIATHYDRELRVFSRAEQKRRAPPLRRLLRAAGS